MFTISLGSVCKVMRQFKKKKSVFKFGAYLHMFFKLDSIVISGFLLGDFIRTLSESGFSFRQGWRKSAAHVTHYEHRLLLSRKITEVKTWDLSRGFLQVKIFGLLDVIV